MFFILPCHRRVRCVSCSSSASMILWFLKVVFLGSRLHFSEKFFAQNLKLVRLSNPRKYQIKTLTTAPRRRPVSCTKKRHFRILLGLTITLKLWRFTLKIFKKIGNGLSPKTAGNKKFTKFY